MEEGPYHLINSKCLNNKFLLFLLLLILVVVVVALFKIDRCAKKKTKPSTPILVPILGNGGRVNHNYLMCVYVYILFRMAKPSITTFFFFFYCLMLFSYQGSLLQSIAPRIFNMDNVSPVNLGHTAMSQMTRCFVSVAHPVHK